MNAKELYPLLVSALRHDGKPCIDSRKCRKGDVFFALRGETVNGNRYAQSAIEKGCELAIVDEADGGDSSKIVRVDNVLHTLQELATIHRMQFDIPLLAITGTNGKTTTKELVSAVLRKKYNLLCTEGNLNNHIGVPLTLLSLTPEHQFAVVEMGANHPGEIRDLCLIARPTCGIITNVGRAHLEGFGSYENVIATKAELFDYLRRAKLAQSVIINGNDPVLRSISCGLNAVRYGREPTDEQCSVRGRIVDMNPCLRIVFSIAGTETEVQTQLVGDYNLENILAAVQAGFTFGVPVNLIAQAIADYQPSNNRSQLQTTTRNTLYIDAYNANPSSMTAALNNFAQLAVPHKVVMLGDMLELGDQSLSLHQEIYQKASACHPEQIFLCGQQFSRAFESLKEKRIEIDTPTFDFGNIEQLCNHLQHLPLEHCHILIKGSHGAQMEKAVEYL